MFKPVVVSEQQFANEQPEIAESGVRRVFMVMHGYYGNLFFSKFATGVLVDVKDAAPDAAGRVPQEDQGIANSRRIWAHGLRPYDAETIKTALRNCQARHPEFPPSLPQFAGMCAAAKVRTPWVAPLAIGMSGALRSKYAAAARERNKHFAQAARQRVAGDVPLPSGLEGLKRAIANAVGAAGGDEARELLRLDRQFAKAVSA